MDGEARLLGQSVIEEAAGQLQIGGGQSRAQVHGGDPGRAYRVTGPHGPYGPLHVPDAPHTLGALPDGGIQAVFDGVVPGQGVHPGGEEEVQLLHRELVQHPLDDVGDRVLLQLQAVDAHTRHVVPAGDVRPDGLGPLGPGLGGVEYHQEGLAQLLQLADDPLLRLQVVLPGDVGDGAVGGYHDADGGVLGNDLPGANLGGLGHGDGLGEPGGGHHPGGVVLQGAHRTGHQVAHAVDEPHLEGGPAVHGDLHRLLGDEFGLGGHDGAARAALGQFILGPLPAVDVLDARDDHGLHEPLNERGFSSPHRPHHADIDISLGSQGDILIELALFHWQFLLRPY